MDLLLKMMEQRKMGLRGIHVFLFRRVMESGEWREWWLYYLLLLYLCTAAVGKFLLLS